MKDYYGSEGDGYSDEYVHWLEKKHIISDGYNNIKINPDKVIKTNPIMIREDFKKK